MIDARRPEQRGPNTANAVLESRNCLLSPSLPRYSISDHCRNKEQWRTVAARIDRVIVPRGLGSPAYPGLPGDVLTPSRDKGSRAAPLRAGDRRPRKMTVRPTFQRDVSIHGPRVPAGLTLQISIHRLGIIVLGTLRCREIVPLSPTTPAEIVGGNLTTTMTISDSVSRPRSTL